MYSWVQDSTAETIRAGIAEKVSSFAIGDLGHAADMLSTIWEIASKDGDITNPESSTSSSVGPPFPHPQLHSQVRFSYQQTIMVTSPAHWTSVKMALIKSIRRGVFFDRKYWARQFKTGDVLKPIYFSSIIMSDKHHQLASCTSVFFVEHAEMLSFPSGNVLLGSKSLCGGLQRRYRHRERL